jgi:DNA repair protein RadD
MSPDLFSNGARPTLELRPDQVAARDAIIAALAEGVPRPLVSVPTGGGKSLILGSTALSLAAQDKRVLLLAPRTELILQNASAVLRLDPNSPVGVCSAGAGGDDLRANIVVASTATAFARRHRLMQTDAVLLDECHMMPPRETSMISKIMSTLKELNGGDEPPSVGARATPHRTGAGCLVEAGIFERVVYERRVADMIVENLLCPIRSMVPKQGKIDTRGVGIRQGEYDAAALEAAAMRGDATEQAVKRVVEVGRQEARRSWLVFAVGVEHAQRIARRCRSMEYQPRSCLGTPTPRKERRPSGGFEMVRCRPS